ncbi:MAG: KUP/HAK/KT family potassium transporter, partial [Pseudolabrys sp.]
MSAIPKTGTVNHSRNAHAWAPAALASMGVVFGDIGTSPLYALSVAVKATSLDGQI